jgi:hypothetical protein
MAHQRFKEESTMTSGWSRVKSKNMGQRQAVEQLAAGGLELLPFSTIIQLKIPTFEFDEESRTSNSVLDNKRSSGIGQLGVKVERGEKCCS